MNNFDLEHDQFWFFQDFEREHVDVRNFLFGELCLQQWVLRSFCQVWKNRLLLWKKASRMFRSFQIHHARQL